MPYSVRFAPRALRSLKKLSKSIQDRLFVALELLKNTPRPAGCRKLEGEEKGYRIRVGDYRILYEIEDNELLILVVRVGHRRDVYRGR